MIAGGAPSQPPTQLAGVVARPVAALLHGPERAATVRAVYPRAAYLAVGERLVALTARDGEPLPFGVQAPVASRPAQPLFGLRAGHPATVGRGRLYLHGSPAPVEVAAVEAWDPRPALDGGPWPADTLNERLADLQRLLARGAPAAGLGILAAEAHALLSAAGTWALDRPETGAYHAQVGRGLAAFIRAARTTDGAAAETAARALIGLGPGLTPAADDALGGLLAAARYVARARGKDVGRWRALGRRVRRAARGRTTAVSEALLRCATIGAVAASVGALLQALGAPEPAPLERALGRVLALGHTSGGDTALGILLGARLALAPPAAADQFAKLWAPREE
jgi:hypothetical protein